MSAAILNLAGEPARPRLAPVRRGHAAVFDVFSSGPAAAALWPFTALIAPVLATNTRQFLASAWPAALLLALNYWWVLRSETTLEEAAGAAEREQAGGRRQAPKPVTRRAPFALAPSGRAEVAILWKNLILGGRYLTPRVVLRLVVPLLVLAGAAAVGEFALGVAPAALVVAGALTLLGPYMVRYDLRHDLPRLTVLKTWPVRGATLVRGEVLPGARADLRRLDHAGHRLVLAEGLSYGDSRLPPASGWGWPRPSRPSFLLAQLVIQNAAVNRLSRVDPDWLEPPRGVGAMGQQMLMFAGTLLLMILGVLPAAAVAGAAGFVLFQVIGWAAVAAAALVFSAALAAESLLAIELLGRLIERTDPVDVEAEEPV